MANNLPEIITALGTIILGWFTYNQYTKNRITDEKIERMKREDKERSERRIDNSMLVYGELWNVLYETGASRVYIVQPHPLGHEEMLTIHFEVKRKGVEPMKPHIQQMKISEVAKFASDLVKNLFMYITDIDNQVKDRYARSILSSYGCQAAIVKRLSDNKHDWVGSIFCEFTKPMEIIEDDAKEILHNAATNIQYILPEIRN